jgi:hypothetical protein
MTPCSPPSRRGLATAECCASSERRPSLTASARAVVVTAGRDEETVPGRTKKRPGSAGLRERGRCDSRRTLMVPPDPACHDGVDENKQLSGTGDERALVSLSGGDQPFVKGNEVRIPGEGWRQGGGLKRAALPVAPAVDVTDAHMLTAGVVRGSEPGECCGLLTGELADLGHAHQDGDCGRQPGA